MSLKDKKWNKREYKEQQELEDYKKDEVGYKVEVKGARDLVPKDPNRASDPYCLIGIADLITFAFSGTPKRSKTQFVTVNPVWKDFSIVVKETDRKIRIEIWDKDQDFDDDFEGLAIIDIESLVSENVLELWVPLVGKTPEDEVAGDVNVIITKGLLHELLRSTSTSSQKQKKNEIVALEERPFIRGSTSEMEWLQSELETKTHELLDKSQELEKANAVITDLQHDILDQTTKVKDWKDRLQILETSRQEHEQLLIRSPHTLEELQQELKAKEQKVEKLKEEKQAKVHQLEDTLQEVEEEEGDVREKLESSHGKFAVTVLTTIEELQAELDQKNLALLLQQVKYEELEEEYQKVKKQGEERQNEAQQLREKNEELEEQGEEDRARIRNLEAKLEDFEILVSRLRNLDENISEVQIDLVLGETAKLLIRKAKKMELHADIDLIKAYYQVALNDANNSMSEELRSQARKSVANVNRLKDQAVKAQVEFRVTKVQEEMEKIQKRLESLANQAGEEAEELQKHKEMLELEQMKLNSKVAELEKRERKLGEFEDQCKQWEKRLQMRETLANGTKGSYYLITSVRDAKEEVEKDKSDLAAKLAYAEEARARLVASEKMLKEKVECLKSFLHFVEEQGLLPEAVHFRNLLKSTKHLTKNLRNGKKVKCFISYAWQPDREDNAALQAKLVKIKADLMKAGIEVMLDIHNMEGDINRYMIDGIQESDRVLLICTPRLKQRAEEQTSSPNNLQREFQAALDRQTQDPKFIIPIILEGDRSTAIADALPNILSLDLSDPRQYCENLVSLKPKGLIPMILGLEHDKVYPHLLKGYEALLKSVCVRCNTQLNLKS